MSKRGRPIKEFQEYILPAEDLGNLPRITLSEYVESPAVAFLRYCAQAHYAFLFIRGELQSQQREKKRGRPRDTEKRRARLAIISAAMLPAIMGHFETFQKYMFAGVFELTPYLNNFDISEFSRSLREEFKVEINIERVAGYRGQGVSPGVIVADNLSGWHTPQRVNRYFTILLNAKPFTDEWMEQIAVLWQLRHSIVHTAGILTPPDAQKIASLRQWANQYLVFEEVFITEVTRKMHCVVKEFVDRVRGAFQGQKRSDTPDGAIQQANKLFKVTSPMPSWLKRCSY